MIQSISGELAVRDAYWLVLVTSATGLSLLPLANLYGICSTCSIRFGWRRIVLSNVEDKSTCDLTNMRYSHLLAWSIFPLLADACDLVPSVCHASCCLVLVLLMCLSMKNIAVHYVEEVICDNSALLVSVITIQASGLLKFHVKYNELY